MRRSCMGFSFHLCRIFVSCSAFYSLTDTSLPSFINYFTVLMIPSAFPSMYLNGIRSSYLTVSLICIRPQAPFTLWHAELINMRASLFSVQLAQLPLVPIYYAFSRPYVNTPAFSFELNTIRTVLKYEDSVFSVSYLGA